MRVFVCAIILELLVYTIKIDQISFNTFMKKSLASLYLGIYERQTHQENYYVIKIIFYEENIIKIMILYILQILI